jgi:hypothetical protein
VDPTERGIGERGERQDNLDSLEEGLEGQYRAKFISRNLRNGDMDFLISKLICFQTSDFKDCSLIRELDIGALEE